MNYLLAILLPPVGVLASGGGATSVLLNIVLTLAGYFPGLIHALWVAKGAEDRKRSEQPTVINNYITQPPQSTR